MTLEKGCCGKSFAQAGQTPLPAPEKPAVREQDICPCYRPKR